MSLDLKSIDRLLTDAKVPHQLVAGQVIVMPDESRRRTIITFMTGEGWDLIHNDTDMLVFKQKL